ncbi:hypothetical protein COU57_01985 [Candidatus Pacearchaeota archaeon CG10_big_fil_rev_8_21_14_0_10_32_14]|nr:MAG: hypothetical protein COU57_01985 [Candidatus Pacearchaeota archaeon CG10_big_fil_rev_8_21_14_0_10_32_14]
MKSLYDQLDIPKNDKQTSITREEARFIYNFLTKNNIKKTLEVGFAYGCSASYIISATKDKHYVIDPFQNKYSYLGIKNLKKLKLDNPLIFKGDYSHNVLPRLLKDGVKINFAFIDGGHKFDDIFIDFYYIDLLLNKNGFVLFHDAWLMSTQHVISWIKNNKENYMILKTPVENLILVQKRGDDDRKWYSFNGFFTYKSYLSHKSFILNQKDDSKLSKLFTLFLYLLENIINNFKK